MKKKNEIRNRRVPNTRITQSEYDTIKKRAAQVKMFPCDYVRTMCLKGKITVPQSRVDFDAIMALNRVGVNLNQLTKHTNTFGESDLGKLHEMLDKINEILDQLEVFD